MDPQSCCAVPETGRVWRVSWQGWFGLRRVGSTEEEMGFVNAVMEMYQMCVGGDMSLSQVDTQLNVGSNLEKLFN
jgi:hypothetical protein